MSVSAPSASGRPTLDSPYSAEPGATASSSSSSSRCCSCDSSKPDTQPQDSLSCSDKRVPLIEYIHTIMLEVLLQQQLSPGELAADAAHCAALAAATGNAAAGSNGGDTDNLRLMTLQLMSAECLLTHQNLYLWLNEQLYGLPICTETVKNVNTTKNTSHKGIAYLEPTPPSGIYHTFKNETYPHPEAAAASRRPDGRISCLDHLKARYNVAVQYPELPCIAVQLSGKACKGKPLREQFIHYPLEMCSVSFPDAGLPKRLASYKWTVLQTICSIGTPHYKAAIPPWVAETLNDHYIRITAEAAPTAAAEDETTAVRSGVDDGVSTAHHRPAPEAVPSGSADQPQAAAATVMQPGAKWSLTGQQNPQAVQSVAQEQIVENLQGLEVLSMNSSSDRSGRCAAEPCSNTHGGSYSALTGITVAAAANKACSLAPYSVCTEMDAPSSASIVITKTVVPTSSHACNTAAAATVTHYTGHAGALTACSSANAGCIAAQGSNSSSSAGSSNFLFSGASCTAASSASAHSSVSMPGSNPPDLHSKLQVFINPLTDALSETSAGTSSAAMAAADAAAAGQVALSIGPQSQQQQQKFAVAPSTSIAAAVAESPAATPCQQYCSAAVTVGHAPATAAAAGSMSSAAFHTGIEAVVPQGMKTATTSSAEAAVAAATPTGQLTATVPAAERSSSAPAARAAAELASPANNNLGLRSSLQATASGEPSSSSSSSSSIDSRNMPDHNSGDPIDVPSSVQEGFSQLLSNLYPSDQRQQQMKRALNTVCGAVRCASNRQKSVNWVVAQIVKAGSFVKKTSLAGTSDLDIVIKLIPCQTPYQKCRCELLDAVAAYMCRPADSSNAARPDRGWQLQPCHSHHYVKLHHPELELYLDIQVAEHFGDKHQQKEALLGWLLQTAAQHEAILAGQATEADFSDSLPGSGALLENEQLLLRLSERCGVSRERVTNLTELTTEVVTGVDQRMIQQHEVHGMGRLCTDIIRALKAWSKFGLPKALEAEVPAAIVLQQRGPVRRRSASMGLLGTSGRSLWCMCWSRLSRTALTV